MTNSQDRSFKYLKNNFIRTNRGSVVFFVSVNHEDLILNDQNYYHAKFELKDKFSEKTVMLDSQKKFELEVGYNYFIQALRPQVYKHRAPGRNSGCAEAGTCGGCEYKRLVAGDFVKTEATSTSQLGLAVKVNGRVISEADTVSKIINTGALSIILKPTEYSLNGGSLEILQQEAIGLSSAQSPYEVSPACTGNIATENVVRSAKAELAVTLKIWGRGEELRKIKL